LGRRRTIQQPEAEKKHVGKRGKGETEPTKKGFGKREANRSETRETGLGGMIQKIVQKKGEGREKGSRGDFRQPNEKKKKKRLLGYDQKASPKQP